MSDRRLGARVLAALICTGTVVLACGGLPLDSTPAGGPPSVSEGPLFALRGRDPQRPFVMGDGYVDTAGDWVIPPPVTGPEALSGATAVLRRGKACVFVDRRDGVLKQTEVGEGEACLSVGADGIARVLDDALVLVGPDGSERARVELATGPWPSLDGEGPLALCQAREQCGYLRPDGSWLGGKADLLQVRPFGDRHAAARSSLGWHVVHADGQRQGTFEVLFGVADGFAVALSDQECAGDDPQCAAPTFRHALVRADGTEIADLGRRPLLEDANPERLRPADGLVLLPTTDGRGAELIDAQGQVVHRLDAYPAEGWRFSEGLAAVRNEGGWSYVDPGGATAIEGPFDLGGDFHDGWARVAADAWIDRDGQRLTAGP